MEIKKENKKFDGENKNEDSSNEENDILQKIEKQISFLKNKFEVTNLIIDEEKKENEKNCTNLETEKTRTNSNPEIQQNLQSEK